MEGLAAVGTAAALSGLATLALKIASLTQEYIQAVCDAPKTIQALVYELNDLSTIIHMVETHLHNRGDAMPMLLTLETGAAEAALGRVFDKLRSHLEGSRLRKAAQSLKWPFAGKGETEGIIRFVHRYVAMFHTAIDTNTNENVAYLVQRSKENLNHDILDWLCPSDPDPGSKLANFLARRKSPDAGKWLLDHTEYTAWKDTPGRVLWLYGDGGAGKTILASVIVEERLAYCSKESNVGLAFLYFDYTSPDSAKTLRAALSSLARQLIVEQGKIPTSLENQFKANQSRLLTRDQMNETQLFDLLVELSGGYTQIYLIVDALDELKGSETPIDQRTPFLRQLKRFESESKCAVNVLVTSRPGFHDIQDFFSASQRIEIKADQNDIEKYIESELRAATGLLGDIISQDEGLLQLIPGIIASKSQGMFLISVLYLELVRGATSRGEVDEILDTESLEGSLNAIYDQTVQRIQNQNVFQARLGQAILKWVFHTDGRLTTTALLHALALDPTFVSKSPKTLEAKYLRPERAITMFCAGLVMIEPGSRLVRFKHYTTQQYFNSRPNMFKDAEFDIAKTALRYCQLGALGNPADTLTSTLGYGDPPSDNCFTRRLSQQSPRFPLLDLIDQRYRIILQIQKLPEHIQDNILTTVFTKPASLDLYGQCNTETRKGLQQCLQTLLSVQVPFSSFDVALFLDRGVTPSDAEKDFDTWGPQWLCRAIRNEAVSGVSALIDFGVRVDDGIIEVVARKLHENHNLSGYLIKSDSLHIFDLIGDIQRVVREAWKTQHPDRPGPIFDVWCKTGENMMCNCPVPILWNGRRSPD